MRIKRLAFLVLILGAALSSGGAPPPSAQNILDTSKPLDDATMFGGSSDIITVVDTEVAASSIVELVEDTKTYPVFLLEGEAAAGMQGSFVPYGATASDSQSLFGGVSLDSLAFTFLPSKNYAYNLSLSGSFLPTGAQDLKASAYADLRASEFFRLYGAVSYDYNISTSATSLTEATEGFSLDEIFVDAAIGRSVFFRMGKQRIRWGVGNWYKPSDVLSLSAIDPDRPRAEREGPFAFKADMPFGLNHATLYVVPPTEADELGTFSIAERTDFVVGGFELSLAGFYRSDMMAKPRLMFLFTGAVAGIDVYGETVASWGSDRIYARSDGSGGYEAFMVENQIIMQSTLGAKFSKMTSDGFSLNLHVQGYYNGMGYADSTILASAAARNAIKGQDGWVAADISATGNGMWYLAGSLGLGFRQGRGKNLLATSFSAYALHNFSDGSTRLNPNLSLQLGSGGSGFRMQVSSLSSFGPNGSEYAPRGNVVQPAFEATLFNQLGLGLKVPLRLDQDFAVSKAGIQFDLSWTVVDFERR